jgi:hypothetical protein
MLAKRWKEHADSKAAERMITSHLRLVAKIAMGYRGYGLPIGEVISEGNVGLMQAVKRFEPDKGFRLATYAMWWIIFPGALVFFLFWGTKKDFLKLCFILFGGYTICMVVYTIWPNGLNLREPLESADLFSAAVNWLRSIDPPRNVCPSMHVSSTIAIDLVVRECRYIKLRYKNIETIIAVLICLSTMFIKQHSVVDVVLGWAMSVLLWFIWKTALEICQYFFCVHCENGF